MRGLSKPEHGIYRLALERLDVDANSTLMVGDSYKNDFLGPKALEIHGCHLIRDPNSKGNHFHVRSLSDILQVIQ